MKWDGILIEPHPVDFSSLARNRPRARLYNKVVSDSTIPATYSYFDNPNLSAVSGISSTLAEKNIKKFCKAQDSWGKKVCETSLHEVEPDPVTLDWVLDDSSFSEILLCSIDVEGHELNVLNSCSFNKDISFFLIEKNPNHSQILELMQENDYLLLGDVAHNTLCVHKNHKQLAH